MAFWQLFVVRHWLAPSSTIERPFRCGQEKSIYDAVSPRHQPLSATRHKAFSPSQPLTEWLAKQMDDDLFICSLSLAEIYRGILEKPSGKKRRELEEWFKGTEGPQALFRGRVLAFDEEAALIWARLMSQGTHAGRPAGMLSTWSLRRSGRRTTAWSLRTTKSTFPA